MEAAPASASGGGEGAEAAALRVRALDAEVRQGREACYGRVEIFQEAHLFRTLLVHRPSSFPLSSERQKLVPGWGPKKLLSVW